MIGRKPETGWKLLRFEMKQVRRMDIHPITLNGKFIRLEPMSKDHVPALARVGLEPLIWQNMIYGPITTEDDLRQWVGEMLRRQALGGDLPFTVIQQASGQPIGATRYMEIRPQHRNLEIGGTWYGLDYQGSGVNAEAKYLLLRQAFEVWGCVRVQIKTDVRNTRSQRAIERLGAVKEGVLRDHIILPDGFVRSSVMYSILAAEWPAVKQGLEERLAGLT
jgi:RimJ/RimL family protein N-acetyltransferase